MVCCVLRTSIQLYLCMDIAKQPMAKKRKEPMNPRIPIFPLLLLATLTLACGLLTPSVTSPGQTPTPAILPADTPAMSPTGQWIEKNGYGIQLMAAEKTSAPVLKSGSSTSFPVIISPAEGQIFVKITFELSVNGQLLGYTDLNDRVVLEVSQLMLVDSNTHTYMIFQDAGVSIILDINGTWSNDFVVYFSVPIESKGFKLQYRDLPQIDLGL